jgi:4'-phosphopantetheinyl transferase
MRWKPSRKPPGLLWPEASLPVTLSDGEVHVWSWTFERDAIPAQAFGILDEHERARSLRFRFAADQLRYSICHANLRRILGSYLERPAESLRFREGPGGKPELDSPTQPLNFNLSHSRSLALLAVSWDITLGVDVEDIRPIEPAVARRFFSISEFASLSTLEGEEWLDGFYRCWTRKEAILKAEGVGLSTPLNSFDVSLLAGEPAALLAARPESKFTERWSLHHLSASTGTMAALAVSESDATIRAWALAKLP